MEKTTLTIYKSYFKNHQDSNLSIYEPSHNCFFCKNEQKIRLVYHCKDEIVKFILLYLNHLKFYRVHWKKVQYFIRSIELSNFCNNNIVGKWVMDYWREKDIYILCLV